MLKNLKRQKARENPDEEARAKKVQKKGTLDLGLVLLNWASDLP